MLFLIEDLDEESEDEAEKEKKARAARIKSERDAIMYERKTLPIFPYRQELLDAIDKHQVF